jgi:hypothetical protein
MPAAFPRKYFAGIILVILLIPGVSHAQPPGGGAFLKSLVIPGWGQYSLGSKNLALTFLGSELSLIGGMLVLEQNGKSARDDYKTLAAIYAGVNGDHGHDFYVDVGNWMTVNQFNEQRLRDRAFDRLYTDVRDRWYWDSDEHRSEMEKLRIRSDRYFNSVMYLVGGLVLNHLASAIHAGRLAVVQQRAHASLLSPHAWTMSVNPQLKSRGIKLNFTHTF